MINALLCEVLSMCHNISVNSKAEVFFEYAPHCDAYTVRIFPDGWQPDADAKYITEIDESITKQSLKNTITMLKGIALFLEVEA